MIIRKRIKGLKYDYFKRNKFYQSKKDNIKTSEKEKTEELTLASSEVLNKEWEDEPEW